MQKFSNDSLIYPLKLDYAEVEYRNRQDYKTINGTHWREKILLDKTIEKGQNCIIKFFFRGTPITYTKKQNDITLEYPQNIMINRIRFHYSNKKTKWFIVGEMFYKKINTDIWTIKYDNDVNEKSEIFLAAVPRSISHPKLHIIKAKS